jgi:hypothetical protein
MNVCIEPSTQQMCQFVWLWNCAHIGSTRDKVSENPHLASNERAVLCAGAVKRTQMSNLPGHRASGNLEA